MNVPTALIAHPFPIVVDAIAAVAVAAGYAVVRTSDAAVVADALAAGPELALIAATFDAAIAAAATRGLTRTLILADQPAADGGGATDGVGPIALTAPAERITAAIVAAAAAHQGSTRAPALTPRERDVARLVAAGQRNRVIATSLGISEGTVKMHLHNVYVKLGLESRTQLAMAAGGLTR